MQYILTAPLKMVVFEVFFFFFLSINFTTAALHANRIYHCENALMHDFFFLFQRESLNLTQLQKIQ